MVMTILFLAFIVANIYVFFPALVPSLPFQSSQQAQPLQQPPPPPHPPAPPQPPPPAPQPEKKIYTGQGTKIFVMNPLSNDVWLINLDEENVEEKISVGNFPSYGYWDDDGLYISNTKDDTISVIDTFRNDVKHTIPVGETPQGIGAIGEEIFVVNTNDNSISVINKKTKETTEILNLKHPTQMVINKKKDRLYVPSAHANYLSIVNPFIRNIAKNIVVGTTPEGAAISHDETLALTTNRDSNDISFIPLKLGKESRRIPVGVTPVFVTFVPPHNQIALVALKDEHKVAVISLNTFKVVKEIDVETPTSITIIGDNAYVTSYTKNKIIIIDTKRLRIIGDIPTGLGPFSIVVKESIA